MKSKNILNIRFTIKVSCNLTKWKAFHNQIQFLDQHHDNLSILKLGSLYKLKHTNSLRVMRKSDLNRDLIHFEGQTIHPCYVPMPFVTEEEVVKACFQKVVKWVKPSFEQ